MKVGYSYSGKLVFKIHCKVGKKNVFVLKIHVLVFSP